MIIPRRLETRIREYLAIFPAVSVVGPRQAGKTTLARAIADSHRGGSPDSASLPSRYLDLENPLDRAKLADARSYLLGQSGRLTVLDEIHRTPDLFPVLRGVIDERIRGRESAGRFLLLGSASLELLRQAGETLAGRVGTVELGPLDAWEVGRERETSLWIRGGFPRSFLAESDRVSAVWRNEFVGTYLERDIPQFGPRVPAETLRRFWTMLAHAQGAVWNAAPFARSLALDGKTVARYLDLMVDLLLVRRLAPLHANVRKRLVKSPKVYLRDSGLVHTLLHLDDQEAVLGHPVAGLSWEGVHHRERVESSARAYRGELLPDGHGSGGRPRPGSAEGGALGDRDQAWSRPRQPGVAGSRLRTSARTGESCSTVTVTGSRSAPASRP